MSKKVNIERMSIYSEKKNHRTLLGFNDNGVIPSSFHHPKEKAYSTIPLGPHQGMLGRATQGMADIEVEGDLIGPKNNLDVSLTLPSRAFAVHWNNPNNELLRGEMDFTNYRPKDIGDSGTPLLRHPNPAHEILLPTTGNGQFGTGSIGDSKRFMAMDVDHYIGDVDVDAWGVAPGYPKSVGTDVHSNPGLSGLQGPDSQALGKLTALNDLWHGRMSQTHLGMTSKANFMKALSERNANA